MISENGYYEKKFRPVRWAEDITVIRNRFDLQNNPRRSPGLAERTMWGRNHIGCSGAAASPSGAPRQAEGRLLQLRTGSWAETWPQGSPTETEVKVVQQDQGLGRFWKVTLEQAKSKRCAQSPLRKLLTFLDSNRDGAGGGTEGRISI